MRTQIEGSRPLLSIASLWEIAIKSAIGKLTMHKTFEELAESIESVGFDILPILPKHLIALHSLPYHHRDPFDRLLIAQSLSEGLPILTTDDVFDQYGVNIIGR